MIREKIGKLIMRKISKRFCKVDYFTAPYKGKLAKSLRNAVAKSLRNARETIILIKFQVYSLQM